MNKQEQNLEKEVDEMIAIIHRVYNPLTKDQLFQQLSKIFKTLEKEMERLRFKEASNDLRDSMTKDK